LALILAAPFFALRGAGPGWAMFLLAVLGYNAALFMTRTLSRREVTEAWRAISVSGGAVT
jgi:hypothetical protein